MKSVLPLPLQSVSIIIVAHQSGQDLMELIPHLLAEAPVHGHEIIVVDNDSTDDTSSLMARYSSDVIYIRNRKNLGFATAVNQGLKAGRAPLVLLLNPDARINAEDINKMKHYLQTNDSVAAVAPRIEFPDGSLQPSRGSFPSVCRTFAHLFQLKRIMPDDEKIIQGQLRFLGRFFSQYSKPESEQKVDYTTGACVLLRRSVMEKVGAMDPGFFLYYEEIDLAKRLNNAGYSWVYLDTVTARHTVAASSGKAPLRPFLERYRSMCYYYNKHHSFLEAFIVRQLLYITILLRWGLVLVSPSFRLDPDVPLDEETRIYKRLLRRRLRRS